MLHGLRIWVVVTCKMALRHQRVFKFAVAIWQQSTNKVKPVAMSTTGKLRLQIPRQSMGRSICINKGPSAPMLRHQRRPFSKALPATGKSHRAPKWVVDNHIRAPLECTQRLRPVFLPMGGSMIQTTSAVATLFLADMSSSELSMVVHLLQCVVSSVLQVFHMESRRWERRRQKGQARRGKVLHFRLRFEIGGCSCTTRCFFLRHSGSINRR